jgi:hypothetical protein
MLACLAVRDKSSALFLRPPLPITIPHSKGHRS